MSELRQETKETYNNSAEAFSEYFQAIGPRIEDIDRAIALAGNPKNPKIVEIGCGDGRDAAEIVKRTNWYLGFDISYNLVQLAEARVPDGEFEVADALVYRYPPDLDIVFAFASLLHVVKNEMHHMLYQVHTSLRRGGIFYLSLKQADEYKEEVQEDQFGRRLFCYYNPEIIKQLAGVQYETDYVHTQEIRQTTWFEMALRKK